MWWRTLIAALHATLFLSSSSVCLSVVSLSPMLCGGAAVSRARMMVFPDINQTLPPASAQIFLNGFLLKYFLEIILISANYHL